MDKELADLKSVLRSLVVSSPAQVDVLSLARDYRAMMGKAIPLSQYGHRDILSFLKERCSDCFLFQGKSTNPILTLIVPDSLKHIDQFVQRSKSTHVTKLKGKRRSVETPIRPPEKPKFQQPSNMICETFANTNKFNQNLNNHAEVKYNSHPTVKPNYHPPEVKSNRHPSEAKPNHHPPEVKSNHHPLEAKPNHHSPEVKSNHHPSEAKPNHHSAEVKSNHHPSEAQLNYHSSEVKSIKKIDETTRNNNMTTNNIRNNQVTKGVKQEINEGSIREEDEYNSNLRNFFKKRTPMMYDSAWNVESECSKVDYKEDNDSGRQTSSSKSSTKRVQLEELKCEVYELIKQHENGVLCTDILKLYREQYRRELNLSRFGHNNINSLLTSMEGRISFTPEAGGVRVWDARLPQPCFPHPSRARSRTQLTQSMRALPVDPDDALPGIDFEPDVFPPDCMHFMESIPAQRLSGICAGSMLEVTVGEVYSPSHFWLQRLGPDHSEAMDAVMDEMSVYYTTGEGGERRLARGAVRPGHYCASVYDGDWHRSLIVKIIDSENVKVRHIDYGTVDTVRVSSLKPLVRRWGMLPAQGVRARLAGLRPGAGGRRWPHAAAAHFLALVRDRRFVANVVAVDTEEDSIETFLIDTSGADDVCISSEMIRAGHADSRADSALRSGECYLYPRFEALESGATPNYGEIHHYLADGINLEFVEAYRRHVPDALPAPPPAEHPQPPSPPSTPPLQMLNRVPLLRISSPEPSPYSLPAAVSTSRSSVEPVTHTSSGASPATKSVEKLSQAKTLPVARESAVTGQSTPALLPTPTSQHSTALSTATNQQTAQLRTTTSQQLTAQFATTTSQQSAAQMPTSTCSAAGGGEVRLSMAEVEVYTMLGSLDPAAAHCYLLTALRRATAMTHSGPQQPVPPQQAMPAQQSMPPQHAMPSHHSMPLQHAMSPQHTMSPQQFMPSVQGTRSPVYPLHGSLSTLNPQAPEFHVGFPFQSFAPPPPPGYAVPMPPFVRPPQFRPR